uniref:NADH-ubiquinone oxidoreductase chain 2 n=1 Tax=Ameletus sp. 1 MT-2014 TaxID=1560007 RepID=A0A0A0RV39_9INSE|nr:NADH dehydrogenase subunit 2 [Ameletus sp. 1 MT-2014]
MLNNPTRLLFMITLSLGSLIAISATSWLGAWVGLEINLLSFIPLMSNNKTQFATEAALKYFLTQALASSLLLFMILILALSITLSFNFNMSPTAFKVFISSTLLLKMGAAPFHFWFPGVMEGLTWINSLLLMTWQKIAPLMLISYTFSVNLFALTVIISSVLIGSLGGFNQTSLRKIMAYSSINHLGWMLSALLVGEVYWEFYFGFYVFLSASIIFLFQYFHLSHINQMFALPSNNPLLKLIFFTSLLSLGGLPPFLGFLPKWIVIQGLISQGLIFLVGAIVVTTLITLYFYLRLGYSAFLLIHSQPKWNFLETQSSSLLLFSLVLTSISAGGLLLCTCLVSIF